jgi:hypothetical protein
LALLTPFYWLTGSSPYVLAVLHSALLFGGVAAWVRLAECLPGASRTTRSRLAGCAALFAICFDSLWGNLRWGFHENAIAFCSLSWALTLLIVRPASDARRWLARAGALVLIVVTAASKEILLVNMALLVGVWAFWVGQGLRGLRRVAAVASLLLVALLLLMLFVGFERMPHPADKNYFVRYYAYLGNDLAGFARALLWHPWRAVQTIGAGELLKYLKTVFLPWLGLPLLWLAWAWRPGRDRAPAALLLALLPSLGSAALATYPPLRGSGFHYVLELWPVLAVLTLLALQRLGAPPRLCWAWPLLALLLLDQDPWGQFREFRAEARAAGSSRLELRSIPAADSVAAEELAGPWVAGRLLVTRWPDLSPFAGQCPDWIVLPATGASREQAAIGAVGPCQQSYRAMPAWRTQRWACYRLRQLNRIENPR